MKKPIQPGQLWAAHQGGHKGLAHRMMKRMKTALPNLSTKHTGSFHGKSNALGHGGRAAQLAARGVPGGVIGNMARAAHAAPGQTNFHGGKKKRKSASVMSPTGGAYVRNYAGYGKNSTGNGPRGNGTLGPLMASGRASFQGGANPQYIVKNKKRKGGVPEPKKTELEMAFKKKGKKRKAPKGEENVEMKRKRKGGPSTDQQSGAQNLKEMKRKGSMCMKCKGGHATAMHGKSKKKASSLEGGASTGMKVNPAKIKNPAWVSAGPASRPSGKIGPVQMSAPKPWVSASTGKPLQKRAKTKKKARRA